MPAKKLAPTAAMYEYINSNLDNAFVASINAQLQKGKDLSPRQYDVIQLRMNSNYNHKEARTIVTKTRFTEIRQAFSNALESGIERPRFYAEGLQLKLASPHSANPNHIYVFDENSDYTGKIDPAGEALGIRDQDVIDALVEINKEPLKSAIEYARVTGRCSCCNRVLTDPASIDAGIGPICAMTWGFN